MTITQNEMKILLKSQQGELDAVLMYSSLAKAVKDPHDSETFKKLASEEGRHASVFHKLTGKKLRPKKGKAILLPILYRLLGREKLYPLIAKGEYDAVKSYAPVAARFPEVESVKKDEKRHGDIVSGLLKRHPQGSITKTIIRRTNTMSKTLVAYFSASGVTAKKAEKLAKELGADLHEIKPAVAYTSADLNWMDKKARSTVEMNDKSSRPELEKKRFDASAYDVVYIGFPIWWYTAPTIINSFLESGDFSGKEIHLFATSGGSGVDKAVKDLRKTYPGLNIVDGKMVNG